MSGAVHPDPHLSDEQLSDLLDGPGDPVTVEHLSACPACSSRLEGWAAVASALGAAVAIPPDCREAAVAAALAGGSRAPAPAPVWMRGRVLGVVAAAAAVIVAVAVGLSQIGGSGGAHRTTASGSGSRSSVSGAAGSVASPVTANLGPLDGPGAVATAVDRALGPAGPAAGSTGSGTSGSGTTGVSSATAAAPTASGSAVQGASGASAASAAAPVIAVPAPAPACAAPTRLFAPGTTQLLLEGPATYRGVAAEVFAYRVGSARRAVVLSRASCAVLAQVPF